MAEAVDFDSDASGGFTVVPSGLTPAEFFEATKDSQEQALTMLGHPTDGEREGP